MNGRFSEAIEAAIRAARARTTAASPPIHAMADDAPSLDIDGEAGEATGDRAAHPPAATADVAGSPPSDALALDRST